MTNLYSASTMVFTEGKGWVPISQVKAGDKILNVDIDDCMRAFFAPVLSTAKETVTGVISGLGQDHCPDTQVLVKKYNKPETLTWDEILDMYEKKTMWDEDRDDMRCDMGEEFWYAWNRMQVYGSCNYDYDNAKGRDRFAKIMREFWVLKYQILSALISQYSGSIIINPIIVDGPSIMFYINRDTAMANNVMSWINEYHVAHKLERNMTSSIISVYDDDVKKFIDTVFRNEGDGISVNSGIIHVATNPLGASAMIDMCSGADESPMFNTCGYKSSFDTWSKRLGLKYNHYVYPQMYMLTHILGTICLLNGISVASTCDREEDNDMWFSNNGFAIGLGARREDVPVYVKDLQEVFYAIDTQMPHILISDEMNIRGGTLARVAPVG